MLARLSDDFSEPVRDFVFLRMLHLSLPFNVDGLRGFYAGENTLNNNNIYGFSFFFSKDISILLPAFTLIMNSLSILLSALPSFINAIIGVSAVK